MLSRRMMFGTSLKAFTWAGLGALIAHDRAEAAAITRPPGQRIVSPVPPHHPLPIATLWVNGEAVAEVVAFTCSKHRVRVVEQHGTQYNTEHYGTLVVRNLDHDRLEAHCPDDGIEAQSLLLRVETPGSLETKLTNKLPPAVRLHGTELEEQGFGWTEDDLTHEVAFTWRAQKLEREPWPTT